MSKRGLLLLIIRVYRLLSNVCKELLSYHLQATSLKYKRIIFQFLLLLLYNLKSNLESNCSKQKCDLSAVVTCSEIPLWMYFSVYHFARPGNS